MGQHLFHFGGHALAGEAGALAGQGGAGQPCDQQRGCGLQIKNYAPLSHKPAVFNCQDHAAARGDDRALRVFCHRGAQSCAFLLPKGGPAFGSHDCRHGFACGGRDGRVRIHKGQPQPPGQGAAHGGLARSPRAHKKNQYW